MTIADQLRAAADVLRRDGWTQQTFHDAHGRHCAIGAVIVAAETSACGPTVEMLARALRLPVPGSAGVFLWNDAPDQQASNVILALEFAALWWEQAQAQTAPAEQVQVSTCS